MRSKRIIEIAIEVDEHSQEYVEEFLHVSGIPYYVEPPREKPWTTLLECEAECEGK